MKKAGTLFTHYKQNNKLKYPQKGITFDLLDFSGKQGSARIINSEESPVTYPWVVRIIRKTTKDVKITEDDVTFTEVKLHCMGGIISKSR